MTETTAANALPYTELDGFGLRLRAWREDDVPAVLKGLNDPESLRWSSMQAGPMDEAEALAYVAQRIEHWERGRHAPYCVTDAATDEVLGSVELHQIELRMGHGGVGYWLLPEARGRGTVTRAVELCVRWGFEQLGLHRIDLGHAVGNTASCRVADRCGFAYEGVLRGFLPAAGEPGTYYDTHLHARLATDPYPAAG
ncbi:GNAT family protein [Streptomyces sp. NPDC088337]|uniref:GNAT family N-acetyltransferase n=1 Tax=unclassified Streptomyces TaxID=2593676 RepID=UPI002DD935E0|nr:GNAT family protein [Streptomyces sp. NBC_01788]WSB28550.1 GNAT family N-acetyltransferase [Streptomyces sp. NBC_01788]